MAHELNGYISLTKHFFEHAPQEDVLRFESRGGLAVNIDIAEGLREYRVEVGEHLMGVKSGKTLNTFHYYVNLGSREIPEQFKAGSMESLREKVIGRELGSLEELRNYLSVFISGEPYRLSQQRLLMEECFKS